ncbi:MAG: IS30 family transposase [Gammaproteobacteria bacterium]
MSETYIHLTPLERDYLGQALARGESLRAIARQLQRRPSTLSREYQRNRLSCGYSPMTAQALAAARAAQPRRPRKLHPDGLLWRRVCRGLHRRWSPEQIAGRLQRAYPHDMRRRVSHETIYRAIYILPRGALRRQLISWLRQQRPRRGRCVDRRGRHTKIPNLVSIAQRPEAIAERLVPGHWEGDLLMGQRNQSAVGTLVERQSRYLLLAHLRGQTAPAVRQGFTRRLRRLPEPLRQTLTYDRGAEMAEHETLARALRICVYFADPHSPWQRGTSENTNGLLRQYLPKGTDLSAVSQRDLNRIAAQLNTRPRRVLDFATPHEVFEQHLRQLQSNPARVALGT